jgi:hypothetical protein
MPVEFKSCGPLLAVDGLLTAEGNARGFSLEDKAIWPGETATRTAPLFQPSLDISPGSPGYLLLQRMKATLRSLEGSFGRLESMRAAKIIRRGQRLVALRLT